MSGLVESVTVAGLRLVGPLLAAFDSGHGMRLFLREMGYGFDPSAIDDALLGSLPGVPTIMSELPDAFDAASQLAAGNGDRNAHLVAIAESVALIAPAVAELADYQPGAALAGSPFAEPTFWTTFAADIPDHLLVTYLSAYQPLVHRAARLLGVIIEEPRPDLPDPFEGQSGTKETLVISRVGDLVDDPVGHLKDLYGWHPGGPIDHDRITAELAGLVDALGLTARRHPVADPFVGTVLDAARGDLADVYQTDLHVARTSGTLGRAEASIIVVPTASANGSTAPIDGLLVTPSVFGAVAASVPMGKWAVDVAAQLDTAGTIGMIASPNGFELHTGAVTGRFDTTLTGRFDDPLPIVGGAEGTRVVLRGVDVGIGVAADPDLELTARAELVDHGGAGLELVIDVGDGDSLLASIVGDEGISVPIDLGLTWSSVDGFTISGSAGLSVTVALGLRLGPITLDSLLLELVLGATSEGDATLDAVVAVSATGTLGPVSASVREIGVALELALDENGAIQPRLGFKPPSGLAIAFEASDAISGGGFLDIDHDAGRYSGGAALKVVAVGISALTVIDTKLPDGGWAFFASLGIDIPGIPIGFGFTLEGVGGLIALNRRIDSEALMLGLREGACDAIMFPDDPVRDSAILIPQIDAYFPLSSGNTVIGPVVEIGWGTPVALVTAQIGVMISLPQGLIVIMGSVAMALPDPEVPVIEINMDALGVIDLAAGTMTVAASLYDSRLLGVIELSGDMAFHLAIGRQPYFALSIGGWHPAFQPPSILPSIFTNLRRIRAEIAVADNVSLSFESYLAITPNTVQFGGRFELVAEVKVVLTTYRAVGWFEFNVLLVFNPFKLVADVGAGVAVYSGDKVLMNVALAARVEGPKPWFASGYARFKFFGLNVTFDFTVGAGAMAQVPPSTDLLELVRQQVTSPDAWTVTRGTGLAAGVRLVAPADDDAPRPVLPDGTLTLRQTVAPLDRDLERYGTNRVAQSRISIASTTVIDAATGDVLTGLDVEPVVDWFAPAQFESMTDAQRLAAPSYEESTSGVEIGTADVLVGDGVDVPVGHETLLWTRPDPKQPTVPSRPRRVGVIAVDERSNWFAPGRLTARQLRRPAVVTPVVTITGSERIR